MLEIALDSIHVNQQEELWFCVPYRDCNELAEILGYRDGSLDVLGNEEYQYAGGN